MRIQKEVQKMTIPRLGMVKVGQIAVNKNGKEYPTSLGHFRFTSPEESRVEKLHQMFGPEPTKIPVTFYSDDPGEVCAQMFELRDVAGKLAVYGDGKNFWESTPTGWEQFTDNGDRDKCAAMIAKYSNEKHKASYRETLYLRFIILGFTEFGYFEFRTMGKDTSIPNIIGVFDRVLEMTGGRVTMVPFDLTVVKHKSERANANRQYPVVSLVCNMDTDHLEMIEGTAGAIKGLITPDKLDAVKQLAAPSPKKEEIEEAEIVE